MGTKLAATFINIGGERKTLHLDGDMWGRTARLRLDDGTALGHIARELVNVSDLAADKQTVSPVRDRNPQDVRNVCGFPLPLTPRQYCLTVAPNVDISLMAAICICFDEIKNDAGGRDDDDDDGDGDRRE